MKTALSIIDALSTKLGKAVSILSLLIAFIIGYEVMMRDFLNRPTTWVAEATIFGCSLLYLLGGPWTMVTDNHVRVDVLYVRFKPRVRALIDCLTYFAFSLYIVVMAIGSVAAGGGLATLIPPSVVFIVYGMTAGCSVGELFLAGIIPGIGLGLIFILYVIVHCWRHPESAPVTAADEETLTLCEKLATLRGLVLPVFIAGGVLGSIYAGIATPSEAAGVGVIFAIIAAVINRRFGIAMMRESLFETLKISSMLAWLFFGAQTIIGAYTLSGGTTFVNNALKAMDLGPWGTIIFMQLIWIFLGCFLDWIGILFLTLPTFLPIVLDMGFDNVWFGVVFCMNMHIAYLSPPFAPSAFYTKSIAPPEITMGQIYMATMPYLWLTILATIIVTAWPGLSLWLPRLMMRG